MRTRRLTSSGYPVPRDSFEREKISGHRSVLLHEAIDALHIQPKDIVLDATLGGAGHAIQIAHRLSREGTLIGIDADAAAIERAHAALLGVAPHVHLRRANFRNLEAVLQEIGIGEISKAFFDLGWSGYQLEAGRGFSFLKDEPLLMTYADSPTDGDLTAATIVNEWAEESIADVIFGWGEEKYSRRIAKKIVSQRAISPFNTSKQLADAIKEAVPASYRYGRIHPATRTFQALRIAVNDELGALKEGITAAWKHLQKGGRLCVITFHSIEDREVKRLFVEWEQVGAGQRSSKRVIKPTEAELSENPRARSAKLRVIEKVRE